MCRIRFGLGIEFCEALKQGLLEASFFFSFSFPFSLFLSFSSSSSS